MKASKSSIHARLYKFTYEYCLPESLCPYFWKLVIAVILFIPNFIIQLPFIVASFFIKRDDDSQFDVGEHRLFGFAGWVLIFVAYIYIVSLFHLVKATLGCYSYDHRIANAGLFLVLLTIAVCLCIVLYYRRKNKPKKERKEPKPSIVAEFIKAKYNRYCPHIEWMD
jgi:hypothetical protein